MTSFSNFPKPSNFILKHAGRTWPRLAALFVSNCPSALFQKNRVYIKIMKTLTPGRARNLNRNRVPSLSFAVPATLNVQPPARFMASSVPGFLSAAFQEVTKSEQK
jgi:hypothetical protein